jgi:hypothetical protein
MYISVVFVCAVGKHSSKGNEFQLGEMINAYKSLVRKTERENKRLLGRPSCIWEGNITVDLKEIGGASADWIYMAQVRDRWQAVVNTVMNFQIPLKREFFD